jgi:hypothetical protein
MKIKKSLEPSADLYCVFEIRAGVLKFSLGCRQVKMVVMARLMKPFDLTFNNSGGNAVSSEFRLL